MRKRGKGGPRQPSRELTIPKMFRFSQALEQQFFMLPHDYLTQMSQGHPVHPDQFLTLVLRVFTGLGMARLMSPESQEQSLHILYFGLAALQRIGQRYQTHGKFGLSGDELLDLREALNLVDALQQGTTRREQDASYRPYANMVGSFERAMAALQEQLTIHTTYGNLGSP